jgi:membrane protein implicated in regulation of membrane protease activity
MYIIALGWLFVVVLMAAAEAMVSSWIAGVLTLLFYGLLPLALFLYLLGTPQRRRNQAQSSQINEAIRPQTPSRRNE